MCNNTFHFLSLLLLTGHISENSPQPESMQLRPFLPLLFCLPLFPGFQWGKLIIISAILVLLLFPSVMCQKAEKLNLFAQLPVDCGKKARTYEGRIFPSEIGWAGGTALSSVFFFLTVCNGTGWLQEPKGKVGGTTPFIHTFTYFYIIYFYSSKFSVKRVSSQNGAVWLAAPLS